MTAANNSFWCLTRDFNLSVCLANIPVKIINLERLDLMKYHKTNTDSIRTPKETNMPSRSI